MNLNNHLVFTLYAVYGILLKGERETDVHARACVCAVPPCAMRVCVFWCVPVQLRVAERVV